MDIQFPPFLQKGDKVVIVSPSSKIDKQFLKGAKKRIESWGVKVVMGKHAGGSSGRYAGTISQRLKDLQDAMDDPKVKAILSSRGGYGAVHLIDKIDFTAFREYPKWLLGFSDITALHNLFQKNGYASLHSLMARHLAVEPEDDPCTNYLKDILFGNLPSYTCEKHKLNKQGSTQGVLRGGNMAVAYGLRGTPYDIPAEGTVESIERKKETKNPPLLYNLAEIQNECSKLFKISPDQTLNIIQELYEKKLVTYPRTDARVLSSAVCKEISKNISGLINYEPVKVFAQDIISGEKFKGIEKTRYCDDKKITDHYAIIPTGQGLGALKSLSQTAARTYEIIVRRFLSIFYPAAVYSRVSLALECKNERFNASFKVLVDEGYLSVAKNSFAKARNDAKVKEDDSADNKDDNKCDAALFEVLKKYRKGSTITFNGFNIKEGETSPPKRYNSGSIILAMENAGQLIEDEELRAQIKGSGIGTSATRAEILKKLNTIKYISINSKTQIITPTFLGEIIYDVVDNSIRHLLNPELTASWEKGLTGVAEGTITADEYMEKLDGFVSRRTRAVMALRNQAGLIGLFNETAKNYK